MGIEMYGDDELLEAIANRGIDTIRTFSDTELNNELTRRRLKAKKGLDKALKEARERAE